MNHIKVELDFIPVEERLPDISGRYFVWDGGAINVDCYDAKDILFEMAYALSEPWTHWAEIPEIKEAG